MFFVNGSLAKAGKAEFNILFKLHSLLAVGWSMDKKESNHLLQQNVNPLREAFYLFLVINRVFCIVYKAYFNSIGHVQHIKAYMYAQSGFLSVYLL